MHSILLLLLILVSSNRRYAPVDDNRRAAVPALSPQLVSRPQAPPKILQSAADQYLQPDSFALPLE